MRSRSSTKTEGDRLKMKTISEGPAWLIRLEEKQPEFLKKAEVRILMALTAEACGKKRPSLKGLGAEEGLAFYRDFTAETMAGAGRQELSACRKGMFRRAYRVGRLLALLPGLHAPALKKRLIIYLYRNIGIVIRDDAGASPEEASGGMGWRIRIPRCSFSRAYTPKTCFVMSGLDAGVICGLFGGGRFSFDERITEGCGACRAVYEKKG